VENKTRFIKEQIEKSGFPFEMKVASIVKGAKWEILPSSPYWDEDEEKWREIDIKAYRTIKQTPDGESLSPYSLSIALIIECKKTDEFGWVFFPWARDTLDMQLPRIQYLDFLTVVKRQSLLLEEIRLRRFPSPAEIRLLNLDPDLFSSYQALVSPEVARKLKFMSELEIITPDSFEYLAAEEKSLSYKEIKLEKAKGGGGLREIFEAVNALIKATKYDMKLRSSAIYAGAELAKRGHEKGRFEIMIFLPLLVFGGELYIWREGEVSEASQVLLEGRCHTKRYFENMLIGVLKDNYLKEFLTSVEKDCAWLAKQICSKRTTLDEQVKLILESSYFNGRPSLKSML
jgi:hypothetical protein